jgi:predicted hydrocarbon binding protein
MGFEKDLEVSLEKKKIRKTMPDKVDIKLYRTLVHSLQWVSVGYASALYFAGKKLGSEIISKHIKGNDIKTVMKGIVELFKTYEVGKLEITETSDKRNIAQLKDCATCYHMESIGKPVCFFEAGLIAGILEAKLKKKVVVNETLCGGLGDEIDEFNIRIG